LRFDGNGSLTGRYLHGEAVDQIFAEEVGGQTRWTLTDHLGSVRDVVSDTGVTLGRITYDSFGQVTNTTGIVDTLFRYTARPGMSSTGLYDYRARTYDPRVGQFLSEDPIAFTANDPNLRRYVGNEPIRWVDPSGLARVPPRSQDDFEVSAPPNAEPACPGVPPTMQPPPTQEELDKAGALGPGDLVIVTAYTPNFKDADGKEEDTIDVLKRNPGVHVYPRRVATIEELLRALRWVELQWKMGKVAGQKQADHGKQYRRIMIISHTGSWRKTPGVVLSQGPTREPIRLDVKSVTEELSVAFRKLLAPGGFVQLGSCQYEASRETWYGELVALATQLKVTIRVWNVKAAIDPRYGSIPRQYIHTDEKTGKVTYYFFPVPPRFVTAKPPPLGG
jgi:RHS repeat-associated protein